MKRHLLELSAIILLSSPSLANAATQTMDIGDPSDTLTFKFAF